MHIFENLTQILGLCPIVKFRSSHRKIGPPNIWRTLSTEKSWIYYLETDICIHPEMKTIYWKYFENHKTSQFKIEKVGKALRKWEKFRRFLIKIFSLNYKSFRILAYFFISQLFTECSWSSKGLNPLPVMIKQRLSIICSNFHRFSSSNSAETFWYKYCLLVINTYIKFYPPIYI